MSRNKTLSIHDEQDHSTGDGGRNGLFRNDRTSVDSRRAKITNDRSIFTQTIVRMGFYKIRSRWYRDERQSTDDEWPTFYEQMYKGETDTVENFRAFQKETIHDFDLKISNQSLLASQQQSPLRDNETVNNERSTRTILDRTLCYSYSGDRLFPRWISRQQQSALDQRIACSTLHNRFGVIFGRHSSSLPIVNASHRTANVYSTAGWSSRELLVR